MPRRHAPRNDGLGMLSVDSTIPQAAVHAQARLNTGPFIDRWRSDEGGRFPKPWRLGKVATMAERTFYEFFAGGGMARLGLGSEWRCLFANDFDPKKAAAYDANHDARVLRVGDVWTLAFWELPGQADLVWASFPCQDLSLAGAGKGLEGERSGAFRGFWKLIDGLRQDGRAPRTIVLENVCGLLTSNGGADFRELCRTLGNGGYHFGALVIDAARFLPQSRPRLFIIGVRDDLAVANAGTASAHWHPPALREAHRSLAAAQASRWLWFSPPAPVARNSSLIDVLEIAPVDVPWHEPEQTERLLAMMSPVNRGKVADAQGRQETLAGTIYKRTRVEAGVKVQRAEVRFDGLAGCLRTPGGGSSRQTIIVVEDGEVRSRLISARETARLMGLPEDYKLPRNYNEAYHLTGDGVAVPVVRFIAQAIIEPLALAREPLGIAAE